MLMCLKRKVRQLLNDADIVGRHIQIRIRIIEIFNVMIPICAPQLIIESDDMTGRQYRRIIAHNDHGANRFVLLVGSVEQIRNGVQ
ncbi:hypothetical protein D3C78_1090700 [compost metagenome]